MKYYSFNCSDSSGRHTFEMGKRDQGVKRDRGKPRDPEKEREERNRNREKPKPHGKRDHIPSAEIYTLKPIKML